MSAATPSAAERPCVLIAGALGVVGRAALAEFAGHDAEVIGLSRRSPDAETRTDWIRVDLTDEALSRERLAPLAGRVTHLVYCALYEERDLVSGWTGRMQIETNLAIDQLQDARILPRLTKIDHRERA